MKSFTPVLFDKDKAIASLTSDRISSKNAMDTEVAASTEEDNVEKKKALGNHPRASSVSTVEIVKKRKACAVEKSSGNGADDANISKPKQTKQRRKCAQRPGREDG